MSARNELNVAYLNGAVILAAAVGVVVANPGPASGWRWPSWSAAASTAPPIPAPPAGPVMHHGPSPSPRGVPAGTSPPGGVPIPATPTLSALPRDGPRGAPASPARHQSPATPGQPRP